VVAVPDFEPAVGGTVRHAGSIARELARRGHDVVLVTRRRPGETRRREQLGGVRVERIGPAGTGGLREARALLALAWWLRRRRRRIAILQTLMWPDAPAAAAVAGVLPRTVVLWAIRGEIGRTLEARPGLARRLVVEARRRQLARCTHVVLTPTMEAEAAETGLPARSVVIPVPVDTDHFRPPTRAEGDDMRERLTIPVGAFVVIYVGHFERRKAVERLVEAFSRLRAVAPDAVLLLVGGGREGAENAEPAIRERVRGLGLDGAVRFCGVQPDPRPFLHAADVLVLPSFREGMPNTLLEAMACGLPCIAPPSAGGDDVLDAGTGLVPRSNEPADLLDALSQLVGDPDRRAALGRAAAVRAQEFAVERVVDRFAALYGRIDRGESGP
jgi:glycosyltransferase involved in cell wall biosynthesis